MLQKAGKRGRAIGVFLALSLIGCSGQPRNVVPADLKKNLLSAELLLPPTYALGKDVAELRAKLGAEKSDKWSIPAANFAFTFRLTNRSAAPVRFAYPSDCYRFHLELTGPGATHIWAPNSVHFTGPGIGTPHTLKPGESYDISFSSLDLPHRNLSWRGFLTQAGKVRMRGKLEASCVTDDTDAIRAESGWATVQVVD